MAFSSPYDASLSRAQMRAVSKNMGGPHRDMPVPTVLAALAKHGGMYVMLDPQMMAARVAAFTPDQAPTVAQKARQRAENFFYKLVDKPGYTLHSELMAFISEPGNGNGVAYTEGVQTGDIPAIFTFVGQFIDHDLTLNGMNLTVDQRVPAGQFQDEATPFIDLDSVYGPDPKTFSKCERRAVERFIFDEKGRFRLHAIPDGHGGVCGHDAIRYQSTKRQQEDDCEPRACASDDLAYLFDPRNDENQLILQIHLLVERFHNALIDRGVVHVNPDEDPLAFAHRVRRDEVLPTWQSIVRNDYLPRILLPSVLGFIATEIGKPALPGNPENEYGALRHKPYRDLVAGLPRNVVRMPHEFAIGFRFGHSQLRPMYRLNKDASGTYRVALLFKDARASAQVKVDLPGQTSDSVMVDGTDDLRGGRPLRCEHVLDFDVFYPKAANLDTQSMLIDGFVTARVFNLPESAIPDDIKFIGNLVHRNLIRSSQIGIVSGEELADFYGVSRLSEDQVIGHPQPPLDPASIPAAKALFRLDKPCPEDEGAFKTPLWFYLLREAENNSPTDRGRLGPAGSRLVGEVLMGALYYSDSFAYHDGTIPSLTPVWKSKVFRDPAHHPTNHVSLHNLIDYVNGVYTDGSFPPASGF